MLADVSIQGIPGAFETHTSLFCHLLKGCVVAVIPSIQAFMKFGYSVGVSSRFVAVGKKERSLFRTRNRQKLY